MMSFSCKGALSGEGLAATNLSIVAVKSQYSVGNQVESLSVRCVTFVTEIA